MKKRILLAVCAVGAVVALQAQSPAHDALKREIAELREKPAVCELPPYLAENEDFDAVCRKAGEANKKVFVSIGREACGRCQRFYELDTNAFVFVRLNIDEPAQREYFLGTFEPPDSRLPFVGVTDAERSEIRPCLSGAPSVADYRKLLWMK